MRALFSVLLLLSCASALLFSAPKSHAQEENIPNEFIFQVMLPPNWFISEAVFAYEMNGKYYLPLAELSRELDFFVSTETADQYASGFAGSEENKFTINGQRNELVFKGERETIADDSILVSDYLATDDLYVQIELLDKIWPIDISIELSTLTVNIETDEELPFMTRKKREERQQKVEERRTMREKIRQYLPRRENPYKFFGKPVIDYQATYKYDAETDDITGSSNFTGAQQFGKMLAEFSTNFPLKKNWELDRPDQIRLKLSRKSAGTDYLLPGLRSVEFGDVNLRQRDLIANTANGRGFVLSNDNKDRFNEFDKITVEGIGPPGWDIELYNNEELIEFGIVPDDGQYFFEDVVLNYGFNQIKLLFFGPQGQVREELRSYTAGGNMLPPGEIVYKAGLLDSDRAFILLDNKPRTQPRGITKTAEISYGVNDWLTVFGNYSRLPESDKDHEYITAGASMSTPIGLVEAEGYNETTGGNAFSIDYITSFFGIRTNLSLARYNDFESADSGFGANKKRFETTAQFNKILKLFSIPLGLRLNTTHTERKTGLPVTTVDAAQTLSRSGIRFSHNTTSRFTDYAHQTSSGALTTTVREGPWQFRGGVNYTIHPLFDLSSINSELRYKTKDNFQAALSLGHNFTNSNYNGRLQLGYDFDTVLGSIESNYERERGWEFTLRATTSFNPYSAEGDYEFSSTQKRQYSPIQAQVFLDRNQDGEYNDGDEPLKDVKLRIGAGTSKTGTDENGMITANAAADKLTNFGIDKSTLVDPYYQPTSEGFSTIPAKGNMIRAAFPVIETGSIEGTIFRTDTDKAVPGLTLELYSDTGEKVTDVTTAFDGYYVFEFVRPGTYSIKAAPSHGVDLFENTSSITMDELFIYGNDLYIDIGENLSHNQIGPDGKDLYGPFEPYGPFLSDAQPAAGE